MMALAAPRLVAVVFWREALPRTVKVEVTVELAETKPPKKERVEVAKDPRAVTVARVSTSAATAQLVPFERQARYPPTYSCEVETTPEAYRLVVVTLKPVAFEKIRVPPLILEVLRVEMVPLEALRMEAKRLVEVTLKPVAFWKLIDPPLMREVLRVVMVPVVD